MAPVVLAGITVAVHRLLRGRRNAWAISALSASVIGLASLTIIAWMSGAFDDPLDVAKAQSR